MDILTFIDKVNQNFDKQPEPRYNTKKYFTDNVDDIGPGPNNRNKIPRLNVMPETYNSEEQGSGVMIDPRGLQDGKIPLPTQGLNQGGIATPKRGLVDEPGSYAGEEKPFLMQDPKLADKMKKTKRAKFRATPVGERLQ